MARKQEVARPLYPAKYEYEASLKVALTAAEMLYIAVDSYLKLSKVEVPKSLQKHIDNFRSAFYGNDRD